MKILMVANYYLVSLSYKFHEDPFTNVRARVVNMRTCNKTCADSSLFFMYSDTGYLNAHYEYKKAPEALRKQRGSEKCLYLQK